MGYIEYKLVRLHVTNRNLKPILKDLHSLKNYHKLTIVLILVEQFYCCNYFLLYTITTLRFIMISNKGQCAVECIFLNFFIIHVFTTKFVFNMLTDETMPKISFVIPFIFCLFCSISFEKRCNKVYKKIQRTIYIKCCCFC